MGLLVFMVQGSFELVIFFDNNNRRFEVDVQTNISQLHRSLGGFSNYIFFSLVMVLGFFLLFSNREPLEARRAFKEKEMYTFIAFLKSTKGEQNPTPSRL